MFKRQITLDLHQSETIPNIWLLPGLPYSHFLLTINFKYKGKKIYLIMSPFLDHVFLNVRGILFVGKTAAFYQLLSQAALRAAAELSANRCRSCLPPHSWPRKPVKETRQPIFRPLCYEKF